MPHIEWSDDYNTGIPDIDKEHRSLFALINDLHDKVESGTAGSSVKATIEALADYVTYHFAREEDLMNLSGYDGREHHKLEHLKLRREMEAYRQSYERCPETFDMADFMGFLSHWLRVHILKSDRAYISCVQRLVARALTRPLPNTTIGAG